MRTLVRSQEKGFPVKRLGLALLLAAALNGPFGFVGQVQAVDIIDGYGYYRPQSQVEQYYATQNLLQGTHPNPLGPEQYGQPQSYGRPCYPGDYSNAC